MRKRLSFLGVGLFGILIVGSFSFSVFAQDPTFSIMPSKNNSENTKFIPGQLIVGLESVDPNFHSKVFQNGGTVIASINQIKAFVVKVPLNVEEKFIQAISKNPNVKYVEHDGIVQALAVPNDSLYSNQWGTTKIGMEYVWSPDFDDGSGITIAVVDEGLFYDHPDFAGTNIRTDIDRDFVNNDYDTRPTSNCFVPGKGFVSESHGTFVTGVIAATINNNKGIAGVGQFDILPIRVLDACGYGTYSQVAQGIIYAADNGADVINLSLGSEFWQVTTLENAVNYASGYPAEAVVVAASGNSGNSIVSYPAGFEKTISVGATDINDNLTDYSQYGNTIDLTAPGGSDLSSNCSPSSQITWILTTGTASDQSHGYYCVSGTSFASPLVAATAGLLKSLSPCATDEDIKSHLEQTALDLGAIGRDDLYGHGRVQADVALSTPLIPTFPCEDDQTLPVITLTGDNPQIIEAAPLPSVYTELGATASDDVDGDITADIVIDASAVDTSTPGSYLVTYNVADAAGNDAAEVTRTVNVVDNTVDPPSVQVIDLDGSVSGKKNLIYQVTIFVAYVDSNDPVLGATVEGSWSNGFANTTCITNDLGQCELTQTTKDTPLTFTIVNVSGVDITFDQISSSDPDGDSDLVSILLEKSGGGSGGGPGGGGPNCETNPEHKKCK